MPACEATAPSSATAAPDPRRPPAPGDGRRTAHGRRCARASRRVAPRPQRQSGDAQRRPKRVLDDRPCGAERVGADAEHDGVAAAQHAARIGEHVRTALEHEADDPERCRRSSTDHPSWSTRSTIAVPSDSSSRHVRRPDTMSRRIVSDEYESGRRSLPASAPPRHRVRWPRRSARTSCRRRSAGRTRRRTPEIDASSQRARSSNASVAAPTARSTIAPTADRDVQQCAGRLDDHETVARPRTTRPARRRRPPLDHRRRTPARLAVGARAARCRRVPTRPPIRRRASGLRATSVRSATAVTMRRRVRGCRDVLHRCPFLLRSRRIATST